MPHSKPINSPFPRNWPMLLNHFEQTHRRNLFLLQNHWIPPLIRKNPRHQRRECLLNQSRVLPNRNWIPQLYHRIMSNSQPDLSPPPYQQIDRLMERNQTKYPMYRDFRTIKQAMVKDQHYRIELPMVHDRHHPIGRWTDIDPLFHCVS